MKIEKYWREAVIAVLLLLLVIPFWRNNTKAPCDVITEIRTVTDTCWITTHVSPKLRTIYKEVHDTSYVAVVRIRTDTVFATIKPDQNVYVDTVNLGRSRLAYAHLVTGTLDSSIYSFTEMIDTVFKTKEIISRVYREPFLEFLGTAKTSGNNFIPGIAVKRKDWMLGYGIDLVNGRHELLAAYRFSKIK